MADDSARPRAGVRVQILDRTLDVLQLLADGRPRSSQELATEAGLHRSIVYRILRTLEDRSYVSRTPEGRYTLGLGLLVLSRSLLGGAQEQLREVLAELADKAAATAFLAVPQGSEMVTVLTAGPRQGTAAVVYHPGDRSALTRGARGLAVLSARPAEPHERPEVAWARQTGYVRTVGEIHAGLTELAAPVQLDHGVPAAVGLVFAGELDEERAVRELRGTAARLSRPPDVWEL
ncbi:MULTISPECIES: IclR family transcriptional regulator [Amycolatopsis]|uniref:DNA-binding transcriptional regulator, IclR family n=2 Tax=Amycolatopsis TaxID=1813 RepID=A0A1I3RK92_9PSEU|nr:helix-turn-helix domain-containing protein [Amycolatopsis sacchari]SFJ46262.1 DNA-binding transcriptional regulator, IclR family [Amycolatopsis sacchari]